MARLLLIHTGGTISMVPSARGFRPQAGVAEDLAREIVGRELPDTELTIRSFAPLVDSADVGPRHWNRMIELIAHGQEDHDGIVVTHGTDTLAFTAAALFFALGRPACPVVITGAMRPAGSAGSDAVANLRDALNDAGWGAPGVRVRFAGRVMAADRVTKVSSTDLDAFREIPREEGPMPAVRETPKSTARRTPGRFAEKRIAVLSLAPGLTAELLDAALAVLDGAVLRCYGAGTMPTDPALQRVLGRRIAEGCRVLAVSQCEHGGLRLAEYAAGAALRAAGVVDGAGLSVEAALARLALSLSEQPTEAVPAFQG